MSTLATAERYCESATGLVGVAVQPNEISEATSYPISTMVQTRPMDDAFSIESLYSLKGKAAVIQFIDEYSFLIPLLLEAREKLDVYFPNSEVSLQVIIGPETEGDYQLLAAVSTALTAEDAYRRLKEFDRSWWLDAMMRSQGLLCISVKLQ
jgi:hypothetical protein